jgi:DHA1 family bicyclomycin/chloramphenicol resistance-like MFS transporter
MTTRAPGALIGLITMLVSVGPLTASIYIPSLTDIQAALGATEAQVQLTVTAYLVGFAFAQLAVGPLSDRYGRRPVLFAGLGLFVLASIGCGLAASAQQLAAMRVVQAFGACTGPVAGRAMVRDLFPMERARSVFAVVGTALAIAPAIAPVLGGQLQTHIGWEANFFALAIIGLALALFMAVMLGESNRHKDPTATNPRRLLANYRELMRHRAYVGCGLIVGFVFFGLFSYSAASPFVLRGILGLEADEFGWLALFNVFAYLVGTLAARWLGHSLPLVATLRLGVAIMAAGGLAMLAVTQAGWVSVPSIIATIMTFNIGMGIALPNAFAGAIGPFPRIAGSASALVGFAQMGIGAAGTILVASLEDGTARPMGIVIAIAGLAAAAIAWAVVPRTAGTA